MAPSAPPNPLDSILIIKTGALGDVLRTTSILPGLFDRAPSVSIEWITAPAAVDLVGGLRYLERVHVVPPGDPEAIERLGEELAGRSFDWVISLDDEESLCRLASQLETRRLSGAYWDDAEERARYTEDVAPWFDMGLLSVHGKEAADRLKVLNQRSHPEIYAAMLGIAMGWPELPLPDAAVELGRDFAERAGLDESVPLIGLNTGAGGRWTSKQLPEERVVELAQAIHEALGGAVRFLVLGGPEEEARNARILEGLRSVEELRAVDAGVHNPMLEFAALVDRCSLLVTSDSLALHIAIARRTRIVAFFAPTSAAEIELYGLGEKVASTAPDYCSYRKDADNSTLTAERLCAAVLRVLETKGRQSPDA